MVVRRTILLAALAAAAAAAPSAQEPARLAKVEQAEVHLVLIDAVVADSKGRPVPGLTLGDFLLRVDGKDSRIAAFEDHCPAPPPAAATAESVPEAAPAAGKRAAAEAGRESREPAAPGPPAPAAPAETARTVLYFDLPHLSPHGAARSVRTARKHVESEGARGGLFMVAAYGPDLRVLTPFTADAAVLLAGLDRVTERGALYDEGPLARGNKIQHVTEETCPERVGTCPNQIMAAREFAREEEASARRSLLAVKELLVALSGFPGRKALVFFTETLKQEPGVQYLEIAKTTPRGQQISVDAELRAVVEEANASTISFYPVHAAGLEDPGDSEIARSGSSLGTKGQKDPSASQKAVAAAGGPAPPQGGAGRMRVEAGSLADAQRTAEAASLGFNASVAAETGGRHLGRTNDLGLVFPLAGGDMSCYYVLAYEPPPPPDGKPHAITLALARRGLDVRHRRFYVDWPREERAARRLRTALAAPGVFREMDVRLDAFALGFTKKGRQVLIKASVPAADLDRSAGGLPPADGAASIVAKGRVTAAGEEVCAFGSEFGVGDVGGSARQGGFLHYEAACVLPPGPYEVAAAVLEERGGALGAARRAIGVPASEGFFVGEAQLWAASPADLLFGEAATSVLGAATGVARGAATPRGERRLLPGEKGSLIFLVCPPAGRGPSAPAGGDDAGVTVTRVILSGEDPVATFPPLTLRGSPDPATGCWGVTSPMPEGVLGEGIYVLEYEVHAAALPEAIQRRASFAVGAPPAATSPASEEVTEGP